MASPLHYPAMLAEHPERIIAAVRAIANAAPGCVLIHCASGKDRTGLIAVVLLALAEASPQHIIADYLLSYARMKPRYDVLGYGDQLTNVADLLATHNTTIESLTMPRYLTDNGLSPTELAALCARLCA